MKIYDVYVTLRGHDYHGLVKAENATAAKKAVARKIGLDMIATPANQIPDFVRKDLVDELKKIERSKPGTVIVWDEGT